MSDRFETRAVHAGQDPDPSTGAVIPPISLSSTFVQTAVGEHAGFDYSRAGNPTRAAYEECLASLEGAAHGVAFASGMAAEDAVLRLLAPGDRVLIPSDAYGGTYRLVSKVLGPAGLEWGVADLTDVDALAARLGRRHAPGVGRDADQPCAHHRRHRRGVRGRARARRARRRRQHVRDAVPAAAARARRRRRRALRHEVPRRPLRRRRRLRGHVRRRPRGAARRSCRTSTGAVPARSTATSCCAASRRSRCAWSGTARTRAPSPTCSPRTRRWHACCTRGCATHPGHDVAERQMHDFGGMVSFVAAGGEDAALRDRRPHATVHAGRVARWRRVADRAPGPDDARLGRRLAARRRPGARAGQRRHRARRRPPRRPRPGARPGHRRGGSVSWSPGDVIVERDISRGRPWLAHPVYVVEDTAELARHLHPGSRADRLPARLRPPVVPEARVDRSRRPRAAPAR